MSDWWARASCRDDPAPEVFFEDRRHDDRARAVRVCLGCPVRSDCLREELGILARTGDEPRGIRAGLSARERRKLIDA